MLTTFQANQFAMVSWTSIQPWRAHEMFAGPLIQINSTIIRSFHYSHYDGMESCIPCITEMMITRRVTYISFCYYRECFDYVSS
jgi:hypothetical protein